MLFNQNREGKKTWGKKQDDLTDEYLNTGK